MSGNKLIVDESADLLKYPTPDIEDTASKDQQFTFDDLHGNGLKFLFYLIRKKILLADEETYRDFRDLYKKNPEEYVESDIEKLNFLFGKTKINPDGRVLLIGDELCDRGMNDYINLDLLKN